MPLVPKHIEMLEPYQAGKSIAELKLELNLKRIVKLASNENPLGASPKAVQAMAASLAEIHRYPNPDCYGLRRALADRFDVRIDGSLRGLGLVALMMNWRSRLTRRSGKRSRASGRSRRTTSRLPRPGSDGSWGS
jgi:histidinol-phosphate aminotransferase